jgi:hypothetical protein
VVLFGWKVSKMRIVRSTSSHASAGGSYETRETLRSGAIQAKEAIPPDDDGPSLNPARGELVSASLNKYRRSTFQRRRSLISAGKQRTFAPVEPVGVKGVGADQKNRQVTWETRLGSRAVRQLCPGRESEGLVVAGKRGNARGAKEPCCKHADINEE